MKKIKFVYSHSTLDGGWNEFVRIYVPTKDQNASLIPNHDELLSGVQNALTDIFGGTTTFKAFGTWKDDEGQTHKEDIFVVESFAIKDNLDATDKKIVQELTERISIAANQKTVTRIVNGFINFIDGKTNEIETHLGLLKNIINNTQNAPNVSTVESESMLADLENLEKEYFNLRNNLGKNLEVNWKDQVMISRIEDFFSKLNNFQSTLEERRELDAELQAELDELYNEIDEEHLSEMHEILRDATPEMRDPQFP